MRLVRIAAGGLVVAAGLVGLGAGAGPAWAACHFFTVDVSPANPTEGDSVEVTVARDAAVAPSSVRVRTVDGTAVAGADYLAVDQRVEFTSGTTATIAVETLQDSATEPDETFTIELSDGGGCQVNQDFAYGPPATVTIRDDDSAAPTTAVPTTAAPTTAVPTTAAPTTAGDEGGEQADGADDGVTTAAPDEPATTTGLESADDAAAGDGDGDGDGGGGAGGLVAALVAVLAAAGGVTFWLRRRRGAPS
ncbi:MAG TPA: Calx-beta domain-containing protein [Acidimicrobiales bacterium]